jgi:rod shape determining protein RodA
MRRRAAARSIDWVLLSVTVAIVAIGWLMLYAASYDSSESVFSFRSAIGTQTIWLGVSVVICIAVMATDWRIWSSLAYPIMIATTLSLVAVLVIGKEIKGATSWFSIFGFSVQPSEFAKLGTALGFSAFLSQPNINLENLKTTIQAFLIFLVPAGLILLQPDAGTSIIFLAFLVPLFRAGLNASIYIVGLSLGFIFIGSLIWSPFLMFLIIVLGTCLYLALYLKDYRLPMSLLLMLSLFCFASYNFIDYRILLAMTLLVGGYISYQIFNQGSYKVLLTGVILGVMASALSFGTKWSFENLLKSHQQDRINVWLRPELCDPQGSLYNIIQSKTAIGSGGIAGKGFLNGTMTSLNYVPEQKTDFIFSTLGEEQGFLGSFSLIILFSALLIRISIIAERAKLPFIRYYAYSIAGFIFFHFFINIGMTMGIMPVIGIPLPLMSKGGSSLIAFLMMIAILLKMDQRRVKL